MQKEETKRKRWSKEEIDYLKNNYGLIPSREIGLFLNRSMDSVQLKAKRIGLKVESKYSFNKQFFKVIDTHEKAYWLGFIYADGYVINNSSTRNYELGITLKTSDIEHLRKFNSSIQGNFEVKTRNRSVYFKNVGRQVESELSEIRVYSKEIVEDLISHGVTPNKSYDELKLPKLENDLKWSFIRGFLDGDGHIMIDKTFIRSRSKIGFTSICQAFLLELQDFFKKFGIDSYISQNNKPTEHYKKRFQLVVSNNHSKKMFLEKCYENSDIFLERKFDNYLILKNAL